MTFDRTEATRAPEVAEALGQRVRLTGWVRRDEGTWLVLGDGTRLRVAGDPWTWPWQRVVDAAVGVWCTPTEPLVVADCEVPLLTASPP